MKPTLTSVHSPLDQVRRRAAVTVQPAAADMDPQSRAVLKAALEAPAEYVPDEQFDRPDAYQRLFEDAPEVPEPNTSWYHPVMDHMSGAGGVRPMVNVVLKAEQERALFLQFNYARYRVAQIRQQADGGRLTAPLARDLVQWYRRSVALRDQIARSNLALVLAMAKRARLNDLDFCDLVSEGNMALLRAIDKFDVGRGFKFSTYACRAILKAFSRCGVRQSQYRQLFPTDFDPLLERSDEATRLAEERQDGCTDALRQIVLNNRASLTDMEQAIIHHRFAIRQDHTAADALTLEQVGKLVGLTKERVRQIQNKALDKIRKALEEQFLDGRVPARHLSRSQEESPD